MRLLKKRLTAVLIVVVLLVGNPGISLAADTAKDIYAQENISMDTSSLEGQTAEEKDKKGNSGNNQDTGKDASKEENYSSEDSARSGSDNENGEAGEKSSQESEKGHPEEESSTNEKVDDAEKDPEEGKTEATSEAERDSEEKKEEGQETDPGTEEKDEGSREEDPGSEERDRGRVEKGQTTEDKQDRSRKEDKDSSADSATEATEGKPGSTESDKPESSSQTGTEDKKQSGEASSTEEGVKEKTEKAVNRAILRSANKGANHNVTMPDRTSHYFLLQKNSDLVSDVSDSNVKVVNSEKEAACYIFQEYPEGGAYNFSPSMTADTKVTVGGGSGGTVSLDQVEQGHYDEFGELIANVRHGYIESEVFDLDRCSSDPYALYTNVGSWYDSKTGKNSMVDMKMTVTGALFPGPETRKQQYSDKMVAPYVGFTNHYIGLIASRSDDVDVKLDFYYHGTEEKIEDIKGILQFIDIDAQQGVDFGKGIEKLILFDTGSSMVQYAPGLLDDSKGYISSQTMKNLSKNDMNTTVMCLFSGCGVRCRFTLSKCDQLDTGGEAEYAVPEGYGIPAADSLEEAICYYYANSTGFMGIRTDVKLTAPPDNLVKSVYKGEIDKKKSGVFDRTLFLGNREDPLSFILTCGVNMTPDIETARYKSFLLTDRIDPVFRVSGVKVYAAAAAGSQESPVDDVTSLFKIGVKDEGSKGTLVTADAQASYLRQDEFYGRVYYVHIAVAVKNDEELKETGISLEDYYQKDNHLASGFEGKDFRGTYSVDNKGNLKVTDQFDIVTEKESPPTVVTLAAGIVIKKLDGATGQPVKGVKFGLFPGQDIKDYTEKDAICLAETDAQGLATFETDAQTSFYREKCGDGPYCIKELSVPESMKYVWNVNRNWVYTISSLMDLRPGEPGLAVADKARTVSNNNRKIPEASVKVYKSSRDTGELLKGAVFSLSEWSEERQEYVPLFNLAESMDAMGRLVYTNKDVIVCTMDNLGRFKISETKAPEGCILTGQEWTFLADEKAEEDKHEFTYEMTSLKKKQQGYISCRNSLQKAILHILKQDDKGSCVEGVVFHVTAAEDIYAPWNIDESGNPLPGAEVLVAKGTLVDRITTGKDGKGKSSEGRELYIGSYEIKEVSGAEGHVMGTESYQMTFSYGTDQTEKYLNYHLLANNNLMQPSFAVAKLADKSCNPEGKPVKFDKKTGRYTEKKVSGRYIAGEKVDFAIQITNTGNTPLYGMKVTDDMDKVNKEYGYSLSRFINMDTASFDIPDSGYVETTKGKKTRVYFFEKSRLKVIVSQLGVGDSIELHVSGKILNNAKDGYHLENEVYVSASYNVKEDGEQHLVDVPVEYLLDGEGNSLVRDQDYLHIPGQASMDVLKTADRTGGIRISNGEMVGGSKVPGIYKAGETVNYHIIVKNTGTVRLKNIHVKDIMSQRLSAVTDSKNASFILGEKGEQEKELMTFSGRMVKAKLISPDEVLLCAGKDEESGEDRLYSGDYVELTYQATLLRDVANMYDLSNDVLVNGMYFDGESDKSLGQEEDRDKIEVPGQAQAKTAKLADRTRGAVLEQGRYRAGSKISGVYESGNTVTYKITVTNSGTANLYHLTLTDRLSEGLQRALDEKSVTFKAGPYRTSAGRTVRTKLIDSQILLMDFLAAGDSVEVLLYGKVQDKQGNLFNLENVVSLEARSISGNEEEIKEAGKRDQEEGKEYKLTYHSNWEKEDQESDGETPCSGGKVIHVNGCSFERPDYIFAGWNTRADGSGDDYSPESLFTMPHANVGLYAQWSRKPVDPRKEKIFRLIYDSNNIRDQREWDGESPDMPGTVLTVDENHFNYTGWTFVGWNAEPDGSGDSFSPGDSVKLPEHDLYLYAQWIKNSSYSLTYDANNGSGLCRRDSETPCGRGSVVTLDGNDFVFAKDGVVYDFTGWNSRPDGNGDMFLPGETKEMNTDVVLYAQWSEKASDDDGDDRFRVYYHANNGTVDYSVDAETPAEAGKELHLDENKFSFGLSAFTGWNTRADGSGKTGKAGEIYSMPDHDVHLYAQWENNSVKLYYHSNVEDGKEDQVIEDAQTPAAKGSKVIVDGVMFDYRGYHFTGWNEKADGSGKSYGPGEEISLESDTQLYAQWIVCGDKYRMVYHSAYPSMAETGNEKKTLRNLSETDGETPCFSSVSIGINDNGFAVPEGFRFAGWNTKADGSGISCQPGDQYKMPAADVHLYAQWEAIAPGNPSSPEENSPDPESSSSQNQSTVPENDDSGEENEALDPDLPSAADIVLDANEKEYQRVKAAGFGEIIKETEMAEPIPVTDEMTDKDAINIPGKGEAAVAKLADKTEGVVLEEGRYKGTRVPGIYCNGERADFSVTVTNTGTADLYEILVKDVFSEDLKQYLDEKTLVYSKGRLVSKNKDTIPVSEVSDKNGALNLKLDHLRAGDQLVLHISAKIRGVKETLTGLENNVHISGKYISLNEDGEKKKIYFDDTDKCHDTDLISAGAPILVVSKLADRTSGVVLKEGRFTGKKTAGVYRTGDQVVFTIRVMNRGTSPACHVTIDDAPSSQMSDVVDEKGFTLSTGDILHSAEGRKVRLEKAESGRITVDRLEGGDSILVYYYGTVKKDASASSNLVNKVTINGQYPDGEEIEKTLLMQDSDQIEIEVDKKLAEEEKEDETDSPDGKKKTYKSVQENIRDSYGKDTRGSNSSVKTGDSNNSGIYIILAVLSLLLILLISFAHMRSRK